MQRDLKELQFFKIGIFQHHLSFFLFWQKLEKKSRTKKLIMNGIYLEWWIFIELMKKKYWILQQNAACVLDLCAREKLYCWKILNYQYSANHLQRLEITIYKLTFYISRQNVIYVRRKWNISIIRYIFQSICFTNMYP